MITLETGNMKGQNRNETRSTNNNMDHNKNNKIKQEMEPVKED